MQPSTTAVRWQALVAKYQSPDLWRSIWQLINTVIPFLGLWALMVASLQVGYWLTLLLAVPTAGFMVRTFIIFHDCGHGSFFKSRKANAIVGFITGVLTLTPYEHWRHEHAIHHATAGDLDRRGMGDVYTMTVQEYLAAPWWKKFAYRIMRQPAILFTVGSFIVFAFTHRFWGHEAGKRERWSVIWTNVALVVLYGALIWLLGWQTFLMVHVPMVMLATSAGVWLFYIQHNFDHTYWERHEQWDFLKAGLVGSSFYKLPKLLQWFTGNIGFHHIHHLSPKIPNYKLEACHKENPFFQVTPLTIRTSLKSLGYRLWDEERKMLVGFGALKRYRQMQ